MAKRTYSPLSDREILDLFRQGIYRVEGAVIFSRNGKPLTVEKDFHKTPYLKVRIYHQNKRKGIMLHKLLWMIHHNRTVPQGHQLHHRKSKSHVLPCDIELVTPERHAALEREALDDFLSR